jgi:hypothetical protein
VPRFIDFALAPELIFRRKDRLKKVGLKKIGLKKIGQTTSRYRLSKNSAARLPNLLSVREEILMNASPTPITSSPTPITASTSVNTPAFWERLWRTAGIQSLGCFIVAYVIYGSQPQVGAPTDALVAFYSGDRVRILISAVVCGFAVLNLMWFAAALRTTLAEEGRDGWGAAATAASAATGGLFLLFIAVGSGLSFSIAGSQPVRRRRKAPRCN